MKKNIVLLYVYLLAGFLNLSGQEIFSKPEINRLIKEENFTEVYNSLRINHQKFSKDPDYIYWLGVCKVELNFDISRAIELLNEATQQEVYKESWFYLGKAKMLDYQFKGAGEMFTRYGEKASRSEQKNVRLVLYQSMCRNAAEMCSRNRKVSVIKVDTVSESELVHYLNRKQIGGKLEMVEKRGPSKNKNEIKFQGGGFTIFSKYYYGKNQKDIFISDINGFEIDKPRNIGNVINTLENEEFVYYDETIPALYFSSQGHNSIGGFDIFKSCYDKVTGKWSTPVNLGFPVNTPGDEIAYVNIPATRQSILAARRNVPPGKVVVYTLENAEAATEEQIVFNQAMELSYLKPSVQKAFQENKPAEKKVVVYKKHEVPAEIRNEQTYQQLVHDALVLQVRSDSIRRISDHKKELLLSAKTESDKKKIWQEIRLLDTKADEIQQKADLVYRKAREIEAEKQELVIQNSRELAQRAFSGKEINSSDGKNGKDVSQIPASGENLIRYRIQVGVFSKPQPDEMFKGFPNLYKEDIKEGTVFKYYVGLYQKIDEAEKGLLKVKGAGFKDAYIIGFYNGRIVPLSRARELEISLQKR